MATARSRERGSVSVEMIGFAPLLIVTALLMWQIALVAYVATSAENAARVGSRAVAAEKSPQQEAIDALPEGLRDGATVAVQGTEARVRVEVPIVVPGLRVNSLAVTRSAELPDTGN